MTCRPQEQQSLRCNQRQPVIYPSLPNIFEYKIPNSIYVETWVRETSISSGVRCAPEIGPTFDTCMFTTNAYMAMIASNNHQLPQGSSQRAFNNIKLLPFPYSELKALYTRYNPYPKVSTYATISQRKHYMRSATIICRVAQSTVKLLPAV